jgi:hypothetical protein
MMLLDDVDEEEEVPEDEILDGGSCLRWPTVPKSLMLASFLAGLLARSRRLVELALVADISVLSERICVPSSLLGSAFVSDRCLPCCSVRELGSRTSFVNARTLVLLAYAVDEH